ncbi:MAG: endonuclease Q family protein [Chloroflexi bacterium]|nr:endonuclease Q family protein [Chloroflexota bacterium]
MTYYADLHLHSSFARATSKYLTLEVLASWARIKGIDLLASADFTHPVWFEETKRKLKPVGDGLHEYDGATFVLGTEVACIGRQGGRGRRVHMLMFAPSLEAAERINAMLITRGKLGSDGRPMLKMLPRELVLRLHDIDPLCFTIPAHLWTPWYGLYGSKSGFDSLEEAFEDAAALVPAVETGLSADPAMCWSVSSLDAVSIVSFSDAHSPQKMARELTAFPGKPSYSGLLKALKSQAIEHTIEFFPEEGMYHFSGHRACGVVLEPGKVPDDDRCPVCRRPLTLGVAQRIEELSDREVQTQRSEDGFTRGSTNRPPYRSLVGLLQIVAEAKGKGVASKTVRTAYDRLIAELGGEVGILTQVPLTDIAACGDDRIAEGVRRVRAGDIEIVPGYDGVYGTVSIWPESKL